MGRCKSVRSVLPGRLWSAPLRSSRMAGQAAACSERASHAPPATRGAARARGSLLRYAYAGGGTLLCTRTTMAAKVCTALWHWPIYAKARKLNSPTDAALLRRHLSRRGHRGVLLRPRVCADAGRACRRRSRRVSERGRPEGRRAAACHQARAFPQQVSTNRGVAAAASVSRQCACAAVGSVPVGWLLTRRRCSVSGDSAAASLGQACQPPTSKF